MPLQENVGLLTSVLYGQYLLSEEGTSSIIAAQRTKVNVPPTLETPFQFEIVGAQSATDIAFTMNKPTLQKTMVDLHEAGTPAPMVRFYRTGAGSIFELTGNVQVASVPGTETPDELQSRELTFSAGDSYNMELGLLFDAPAAGVSATTDGDVVTLAALAAATESITFFYASPHFPAANAVGAIAQIESDTPGTPFTGSEVVEHVFATIDDPANGPTFEQVTIPGPISNTLYRLSITAITSGTFFPRCGAVIHDS